MRNCAWEMLLAFVFVMGTSSALAQVPDLATVTMAGGYAAWGPEFQMTFDSTVDPFPLYLAANTQTSYDYFLRVNWYLNGPVSESHTLHGDFEWGILVPGGNEVVIDLFLDEPVVDHNVTFTLYWGPGTPADPSSWGSIKSLYR